METTFPLPFSDRLWFFEIIVGVLVLAVIYFLFKNVLRYLRQRSMLLSKEWKETLDGIFSLPVTLLLWILGLTLVIEILGRRFEFAFFENYLNAFRSTGIVVCIAWILLRWEKQAQRIFLEKDRHRHIIGRGFIEIIGKIFTLLVSLIALMIILQIWGLNIAPLIAFGGIGAAAAGFAAKDVLANFFGGFMLYLNRPFVTGDTIILAGKSIEGTVEEIGWNLTTIRDKEKRPNYLPNGIFSHEMVINTSRMTHRKIDEKIEIAYEDFGKIPVLIEKIKQKITSHPSVDNHLPIIVVLGSLENRTLTLFAIAHTLETRYEKYLEMRQEILMLIHQEIENVGAHVSIPSMSISVIHPPKSL